MFHYPKTEKKMIKKIAYSVVLGGMLAGLGACSAEPDYTNGADPSKTEGGVWYSFYQTFSQGTAEPGDASVSFTVKVVRSSTKGDFSLPISIEPVSGKNATIQDVTVTPAVFKDGESEAVVTWTVTEPLAPNVYTGNLVFDKNVMGPAGYNKCGFSVTGPYVWEDLPGEGWIYGDTNFWYLGNWGDGAINCGWQPIAKWMKAKGTNRWRAMKATLTCLEFLKNDGNDPNNCYGWGGWGYDIAAVGDYLEFYEDTDDDDNPIISFEPFNTGLSEGGKAFYWTPGNFSGSINGVSYTNSGDLSENKWVEPLYLQLRVTWTPWSTESTIYLTLPGYEG